MTEPRQQKEDPRKQILRSALEKDTFFHSQEERGFVETVRRGKAEVVPIRSREYRNVLRLRYEQETTQIPRSGHLNDVIEQLDARAIEDGPEAIVTEYTPTEDDCRWLVVRVDDEAAAAKNTIT